MILTDFEQDQAISKKMIKYNKYFFTIRNVDYNLTILKYS